MNICINPVPVVPSPGLADKRVIPIVSANGQIRPALPGETLDPCTVPSALPPLVPLFGNHNTIVGYIVGA